MTNPFPAILVGGPPHSGKSVLLYSLTRALREARIAHYVLRACPDGEGDWSYQIPQDLVRAIRVKGAFTPAFTRRVEMYLQRRPLPLLVDVGGRPTPNQQTLFSHCTHAVLVIGDREVDPQAFDRDRHQWEQMMAQHQVPILQVIRSDLNETVRKYEASIAGADVQRLSALHRGKLVYGEVFEGLVDTLAEHMMYPERSLAAAHKKLLPEQFYFLDLARLDHQLGNRDGFFQPRELPLLLERVPLDRPLAVYGRSANWIYAALAAATAAPFTLFDARLGWVTPPRLQTRSGSAEDDWDTYVSEKDEFVALEMDTHSQYLDIDEPERIPLPALPEAGGLLLSGRIPHWLLTAVVRQLGRQRPWVAVYQPMLAGGVVIHTQNAQLEVGDIVPFTPRH